MNLPYFHSCSKNTVLCLPDLPHVWNIVCDALQATQEVRHRARYFIVIRPSHPTKESRGCPASPSESRGCTTPCIQTHTQRESRGRTTPCIQTHTDRESRGRTTPRIQTERRGRMAPPRMLTLRNILTPCSKLWLEARAANTNDIHIHHSNSTALVIIFNFFAAKGYYTCTLL